MSEERQSRPGQATLAAYLIIGGSFVVVLSAWQRISTLHTLEVQEQFADFLADQPTGFGLTIDGLATAVRIMCVIGGGAATASAILGFQVLQRSSTARRVLTALTPFLVIGGLAAGGFFAPMVVAGIALLWIQPTRDWYAGRPWAPRHAERQGHPPVGGAEPARPDPFATPASPASPTSPASPASPTAGQEPIAPPAPSPSPWPAAPGTPGPPAPWAGPPATARTAAERRAARGPRPSGLLTACIATWVGTVIVVLAMAATALAVGVASDDLMAEFEKQQPDLVGQISESELIASVYLIVAGFVLWAIAAFVLGVLTFLGHDWARILLVISAVVAALLTAAMGLSLAPLLLVAGMFGTCAWLLLRRDVTQWFRR